MTTPKGIRVLSVTDFPLMGLGLTRFIESHNPKLACAGLAASRAEALRALDGCDPHLVMIDVDGALGPGLINELVAQSNANVLALTGRADRTLHDQVVLAGANGVISKTEPVELLLRAIERVSDGEIWIDRRSAGRIFHELSRPANNSGPQKLTQLTRKERDVVEIVTQNIAASNRTIASSMNISENTLRNHLTSIYSKLGLSGRMELFTFVMNNHER